MDRLEQAEWLDDLEKIKELVEAINVRFHTAYKTGATNSKRVNKAYDISRKLDDIYRDLDRMQTLIF